MEATSIELSQRQIEHLKAEAARTGLTVAELLGQFIDALGEGLKTAACVACGKAFLKFSANAKVCSAGCRRQEKRHYMQRFSETPKQRARERERDRKRVARARAAREPLVMAPCKTCGKEFQRTRTWMTYCSAECRRDFRSPPIDTKPPIPAFPCNVDPDAFGHWLSGFVDGEGSFNLRVFKPSERCLGPKPYGGFQIMVRADDADVMRLIQSYWQCGTLGFYENRRPKLPNAKPVVVYSVKDSAELVSTVVPHFDRFPLHAKKRRDFAIWRRGIELLDAVHGRPVEFIPGKSPNLPGATMPRWPDDLKDEFCGLMEQLKAVRRYAEPASRETFPIDFPPEIDRNAFGHWLAGFTDAEGYFMLGITKGRFPHAAFRIGLRDDDADVLQLIRSFLGCGLLSFIENSRSIVNSKPSARLDVVAVPDLLRAVVAQFDAHPLHAKKVRDFRLWRKGVEKLVAVQNRKAVMRPRGRGGALTGFYPKWTARDMRYFSDIAEELKDVRKYPGPPETAVGTVPGEETRQFDLIAAPSPDEPPRDGVHQMSLFGDDD